MYILWHLLVLANCISESDRARSIKLALAIVDTTDNVVADVQHCQCLISA